MKFFISAKKIFLIMGSPVYLNAMRAFEASARHESFSAVKQSNASKRLKREATRWWVTFIPRKLIVWPANERQCLAAWDS